MAQIGEDIRIKRLTLAMSQKELAKQSKVNINTIRSIEKCENVSIGILIKVVDALDHTLKIEMVKR